MTHVVTRHPGALEWLRRNGHVTDDAVHVEHFDPENLEQGDTVVGTLPVHLIAEVTAAGATYMHLSMSVPRELRGEELTADMMDTLSVTLEQYAAFQPQQGDVHHALAMATLRGCCCMDCDAGLTAHAGRF